MVAATVGPQDLTASMAAAVVQCSRMIRSLGKSLCNSKRVGKKVSSAFKTVTSEVVEDHVLTLHLLEDRVESFIGHNTGGRVGGHAGRVGLDASDAGLLCLDDSLRRDVRVEVERHEESDVRRQLL
jgi:hypothetical protein